MAGAPQYWLLLLIKGAVALLDAVTSPILGTSLTNGSAAERRRHVATSGEEDPAQLVKVRWKAHYRQFLTHDFSNFLYTHER